MSVEGEFGASEGLEELYRIYLVIVIVGGFLWWMVPLTAFLFILDVWVGAVVALLFFAPLLVAIAFVLYWIPRFCSSIKYLLTNEEVVVTKGIWWKTKSVVPYNRITNINTYQGPISRRLGLGKLAIQTAGFSGVASSGYKTAEAEIIGRRDFEEVKNLVLGYVKGRRPVAVEGESEARSLSGVGSEVLEELRRIRVAVEK